MPKDFVWIAADRNGRLARFDAERWGIFPRHAAFLESEFGEAIWRSIHVAWVSEVAPLEVFEHHDLAAIPESPAPHLVAFARTPPTLPGGVQVRDRVLAFACIPDELRGLLTEDDDCEAPLIDGSLAIDERSFGEHWNSALYSFKRWGDGRAYRRGDGDAPRFPLARGALAGGNDILTLDLDFGSCASVDVAALLPADEYYELGA